MSVKAGVSLPGPFFIAFPVGGPILGAIALIMAPFLFVIWLGVVMVILIGRFMGVVIPLLATAISALVLEQQKRRFERKQLEPAKMTADEAIKYIQR